jgi:methyl-accepting chemotaxis protein
VNLTIRLLLPTLLLSTTAIGIVASSLWSLDRVIDVSARAELARQEVRQASDIKISVITTQRDLLSMIEETEETPLQTLTSNIAQRKSLIETTLNPLLQNAVPERRLQLEDLGTKIERFYREVATAQQMALRNLKLEAYDVLQGSAAQAEAAVSEAVAKLATDREAAAVAMASELTDVRSSARTGLLSTGIAGVAIAIILSIAAVVLGVTRPIRNVSSAMQALADGRLDIKVSVTRRRDEIGTLIRSLGVFHRNAETVRSLEAEQNRLKTAHEADQRRMLSRVSDEFEQNVAGILRSVAAALNSLHSNAAFLLETATITSSESNGATAAAERASDNVQTVAAAAEQLSAAIGEIMRQTDQSRRMAAAAVDQVTQAKAVVNNLLGAANRIEGVFSLVSSIARQTNLLALNATIEAARAGEAGRGFIVVAQEVKSLAAQTARATDEVGQQITGIHSASNSAISVIQDITYTIGKIEEATAAIAVSVEQQGMATAAIARNVQEAAGATLVVTGNIAGVHDAAQETGRSANDMRNSAEALSHEADHLQDEVKRFLSRLAA